MIALVAVTPAGRARARHLERTVPRAELLDGRPRDALAAAWPRAEGAVLFLAAGAAVRLIAPLLASKHSDPGVVCVDEAGRFAVALAGGHGGGANALAQRVAEALGATPVVTTASEAAGVPALDVLAAEEGFVVEPDSDMAAVGAALVGGRPVWLWEDGRRPLGPLPFNVARRPRPPAGPAIVISDRLVEPPRPAVVMRPPSLVVGVGASRGAPAEEILGLIDAALAQARLSPASVSALASVEAKRDEPGLLEAARSRGWPLRFHPAAELAEVPVPNPSEVVRGAVGTPSVAEAAALLEAASTELVVAKQRSAMATVAVARRPVRGRLALVGLGPGDDALLPPRARRGLAGAELVVGLARYVDSIRHLLRPGTRVEVYALGEEVARCRRAVAEAATGASVALVSSGDAGVYGMAAPALEQPGLEAVDVEVVPGITAAHAAASLVGSPLGHDHCAISLSDLLTPWEVIRSRLRAAAEADFAVSLYNPRSRNRRHQLAEARDILLEHRGPDTPVAVVTDAYRPGQRVTVTTLGELDLELVSMTTTVVIGSSQTRVVDGRIVTPRGYASAGRPPVEAAA